MDSGVPLKTSITNPMQLTTSGLRWSTSRDTTNGTRLTLDLEIDLLGLEEQLVIALTMEERSQLPVLSAVEPIMKTTLAFGARRPLKTTILIETLRLPLVEQLE